MLTVVRSDVDAVIAAHVTADDLASFEGDGYRYDLLKGNLTRVSPRQGFATVVWLLRLLVDSAIFSLNTLASAWSSELKRAFG